MGRARRRILLFLLAGLFAAGGLVSATAAAGQRFWYPMSDLDPEIGPELSRYVLIWNRTFAALSSDLVCVNGGDGDRVVWVARPSAVPTARAVLRTVHGGPQTSVVRVGQQRRNEVALKYLEDTIEAGQPAEVGVGRFAVITLDRVRRGCPGLVLGLDDRDRESPVVSGWARAVQRRYGADRIRIEYGVQVSFA